MNYYTIKYLYETEKETKNETKIQKETLETFELPRNFYSLMNRNPKIQQNAVGVVQHPIDRFLRLFLERVNNIEKYTLLKQKIKEMKDINQIFEILSDKELFFLNPMKKITEMKTEIISLQTYYLCKNKNNKIPSYKPLRYLLKEKNIKRLEILLQDELIFFKKIKNYIFR